MNTTKMIEAEQLSAAKFRTKEAQLLMMLARQQFRPSYQVPVTVKRDGSRWICLLESSPEMLECPVAYGSCPEQAMDNFDALWSGAGYQLEEADLEVDDDDDEYQEKY